LPVKDVLLVDKGNHSLKAVLSTSGRFVKRWRSDGPDQAGKLMKILEECSAGDIVFCSVVPDWSRAVRRKAARLGDIRLLEASTSLHLPYAVLVERPDLLGSDRLAAACGAVALGHDQAVIVDAGTAVTVDVLGGEGFLGGAIFPGLDLLRRTLHEGTAALPGVSVESSGVGPPGRSTGDAIASGTYWGLIGAVNMLVDRSRDSISPDAAVLVTGGDADKISRHIGGCSKLVPDLVFLGLNLLFELNNSYTGSP
jgi:type III pantothenate kinase